MNWKTLSALFARDVRVARRNAIGLVLQTLLQPLMFIFVLGQVMTRSGMMASNVKGMLVPGIMGVAMMMTGMQTVAMPLLMEFQFTREIEDRLLAPIRIEWVAVQKILSGTFNALVSGAMVALPAGLILGKGTKLSTDHLGMLVMVALLVALFSASGGLTLGCSVGQTHIGLVFSLVLAPMIMFGCAYYPWQALSSFPVLQKLVLVNPLVYASEGLRASLAPQYPHMPILVAMGVLAAMDAVLIGAGLYRFNRKAVS